MRDEKTRRLIHVHIYIYIYKYKWMFGCNLNEADVQRIASVQVNIFGSTDANLHASNAMCRYNKR